MLHRKNYSLHSQFSAEQGVSILNIHGHKILNRKIYIFEVCLILLPVTVILIPGILYMFLVPFGELVSTILRGTTLERMRFITYQSFTVLSACSIYSMWIASHLYISKNKIISFSKNPYLFISIIIGIVISLIGLMEILNPDTYIKEIFEYDIAHSFLNIYFVGLPISIPALHIIFMSQLNHANK